jgi:hypothetical protein
MWKIGSSRSLQKLRISRSLQKLRISRSLQKLDKYELAFFFSSQEEAL